MSDAGEDYQRVLSAERDYLCRARTYADLARWRDRLVAELINPASPYAQALEAALARNDLAICPSPWFLVEWSEILVDTFHRLQGHKIICGDTDPRDLATLTLAAICGGTLIATTAQDRSALVRALDMALHQIKPSSRT